MIGGNDLPSIEPKRQYVEGTLWVGGMEIHKGSMVGQRFLLNEH